MTSTLPRPARSKNMSELHRRDAGHADAGGRNHRPADTGSVSLWIQDLRGRADQRAANHLFRRYFEQLVVRLRNRVNRRLQAVSDSHDLALFALGEVLRRLQQGHYPDLNDREGLWAMMVAVAEKRCRQNWRDGTASLRDVRRSTGQLGPADEQQPSLVDALHGSREFSPEFLAELEDQLQYLSHRLGDKYRDVLIWELQGYTPAEVQERMAAAGVNLGERQIRRMKCRIREELRLAFDPGFSQP